MKNCHNCHNEILGTNKFCSNCGFKIDDNSENKIDASINLISKNVNSIKKEIVQSEYVNLVKSNSINAFTKIRSLIIAFFGYLGLIIILVQLFNFFVVGIELHVVEAYNNYFVDNSSSSSFLKRLFVFFLPEVLLTTILPFTCMFLHSKRGNWLFYISIISLFLFFMSFIVSDFYKNVFFDDYQNNSNIEKNIIIEPNEKTTTTIDSQAFENDESNSDKKSIEIKKGSFRYLNNNYDYDINCISDMWGKSTLKIYKNSNFFYVYEYSPFYCNIENIIIENNYFYFEYIVAGGSNGMGYKNYFVLDISTKSEYILEKTYSIDDPSSYWFQDLVEIEKIKKNKEVYQFLSNKINFELNDI